jgi:bifunctional non-homologous end joining protein LigD
VRNQARRLPHDGPPRPGRVRLVTRNGHDWADRYPLIVEAAGALKVRSFLLDGEGAACDGDGMPVFDLLRYWRVER